MIVVSGSNPLPDSVRCITDARRTAESELNAALTAIPESERIEDYVPPFCVFATSLFDAEAEQALTIFHDKEAYKRFLEQDLTTRIIEGILPDQGLKSVRANWSPEVARLSIENEVGSETLTECRPDGTIAPARAEIQGVHAQHGDWENFAPLAVRFRLRFEKNALVRENLRQVLERKKFYWLDRFSLRPSYAGPPQNSAVRVMPELPVLTEATKRRLELQWETVRDKQKVTEQELSDYDKERQRLLRMPANPPSHVRPLRTHMAAHNVGLTQSVSAAEARFRGKDREYWPLWCSSALGYEVYHSWLDSVTGQISDELRSIWKGRSAMTDQWFQTTCAPAIKKALAVLVKQRIAQARDVETKRLECPSSADAGTGNPVADEILARANDPESMRRLIESGDDSLSPPAQGAIQLARTRIKAESPDAPGKIADSQFWRDIEARFRAIQSRKIPVHGVPWVDDSLYAVWLATAWSETGDEWRLDGANPTVRVNFEWLAERAAVELGHRGGRSAVVFWLDLLRRDSPNYKGAGGGRELNDLIPAEHGKIDRVCEASADYCLRLETQDRIKATCAMAKDEFNLTEAIAQAEEPYQVGKENVVDADTPLAVREVPKMLAQEGEAPPVPHATSRLEVVPAPRLSGEFDSARAAKEARAMTVAKLIKELNDLKPQIFEDEAEYTRLRAQYPVFLTFSIADKRPDLKQKVLAIRSSTRHIRLAQELAAAHHGRQLSTIQDDWKDHKPEEFKRNK